MINYLENGWSLPRWVCLPVAQFTSELPYSVILRSNYWGYNDLFAPFRRMVFATIFLHKANIRAFLIWRDNNHSAEGTEDLDGPLFCVGCDNHAG